MREHAADAHMNAAAPGRCDLQVVTKDIELFGAIEDGLIVVRGHRAELNQRSLGDRYAPDLRISRGKPDRPPPRVLEAHARSEEHTSELQSLMRISYAVFCLKKKNTRIRYQLHEPS